MDNTTKPKSYKNAHSPLKLSALICHINDFLLANVEAKMIEGFSTYLPDTYSDIIKVVIFKDDFKEYVQVDARAFFSQFDDYINTEFIDTYQAVRIYNECEKEGDFSFEEDFQFSWCQELADVDAFIEEIKELDK